MDEPVRNIAEKRYSVIVPAYNAEKTLSACLESLGSQSVPQAAYEVIVVDDGSSDLTSNIVKRFKVQYIFQTHKGPAAARNRGADTAKGDTILFTDSDCIPDRNWIMEMVSPFQDSEIIGVRGSYKTNQKTFVAKFAQAEFEDRYDLLQKRPIIDMVCSYSAAFRKNIFLDIGGFDENFPVANNEDTDLSYRMAGEGYKLVFNPSAFVYHTHPISLVKYLKIKFWRAYWRMVVYRRYPGKAMKDSYTPAVIKIQTLLMCLSFPFFFLSFLFNGLLNLALFFWVIIIVSSFPFSLKTFKKDKAVGLISPWVILARSMVFACGCLMGMARCLCHDMDRSEKKDSRGVV